MHSKYMQKIDSLKMTLLRKLVVFDLHLFHTKLRTMKVLFGPYLDA